MRKKIHPRLPVRVYGKKSSVLFGDDERIGEKISDNFENEPGMNKGEKIRPRRRDNATLSHYSRYYMAIRRYFNLRDTLAILSPLLFRRTGGTAATYA